MMIHSLARGCALFLCVAVLSAPALAQQDSSESGRSGPELSDVSSFPGFLGGDSERGGSGFTSRFDPRFNPAIGIVLDGFWTHSIDATEESAGSYDRADLRALELNFSTRIDALGWAYTVAEFGNEGEGEYNFELLEAAMWFDQLPNDFSIRAGRFLSDFGKWNTVHVHDRPYPFSEGARSEYLGGGLILNGLELHKWFSMGDTPVRWSLGIAPSFEGHGHSVFPSEEGHDEEEGEEEEGHDHHHGFGSETDGERDLDSFAFTGRLTAQHGIGSNGYFQWGLSAFMTDGGLAAENEVTEEEVFGLGQTTFAVDLLYRSVDPSQQTSLTAGLELFFNDRDIIDEGGNTVTSDGVGMSAFVDYGLNADWSVGLQASQWEHAEDAEETGKQAAVYATWDLSEFQRLRLALAHWEPMPDEDADMVLALQWVGIMGAHCHTLDF